MFPHNDEQALPDIRLLQPCAPRQDIRHALPCPGQILRQYPLPLYPVKVLGKAPAPAPEVVALDEQHEQGVELIIAVEDVDEVPRVALGEDGQYVADGWLEEVAELRFGEELEEGGFGLVEAGGHIGHELHGWRRGGEDIQSVSQ